MLQYWPHCNLKLHPLRNMRNMRNMRILLLLIAATNANLCFTAQLPPKKTIEYEHVCNTFDKMRRDTTEGLYSRKISISKTCSNCKSYPTTRPKNTSKLTCNLCGKAHEPKKVKKGKWPRLCTNCGSYPRLRGMVYLLSNFIPKCKNNNGHERT